MEPIKKVAIVNANSYARYFPEFIKKLEQEVGEVKRITVSPDIGAEELAEQLKGYAYLVVGTTPVFSKNFFSKASSVKYIARFGIGYNNVDVPGAREYGVLVSNVPGVLEREDVAEQAVALVMALSKHVVDGSIAVHNNEWNVNRGRFLGNRLQDKTVGVLGYGNIGSAFGRIMARAFGCRILAYDPYLTEEQIRERGAEKMDMDEVLSQSDIISLHINLTPETYHLISKEQLEKMKRSALLINTARGALVDEHAVAKALEEEKLGGYGADVTENEPVEIDNPLLKSARCVITPHLATYNWECNHCMCQAVTDDVIRVSRGELPRVVLER